jgi:hypothetical protein
MPVMMADARLAEITEHLALWSEGTGEFSLVEADELLREVNHLRRQHEHDVHLLRRCRDELIRVNDQYHDLMERAEAWAAHDRAERDPSARFVQDEAAEPEEPA